MASEVRFDVKCADGRRLHELVLPHPATTYDSPNLPHMSESLTYALDQAGFSQEHRASVANYGVMRQMMHTISALMKNGGHSCALRMGSSIEGTTASGMGSDADVLYFPTLFKAYRNAKNIKEPIGLVLVHDESTPAGHTKLQPACNGSIINDASDIRLKKYLAPNVKFQTDNQGQLMMLHVPAAPRVDKRHGPADTIEGRAHQLDKDFVMSITSDDITKEMEEWCNRDRKYGWPSKATCDLFKKLGCFLVCAGHPSSPEQQLEWRMCFSLQERHLMRHLNPTQYHCVMLLKLIKKCLIKPNFGDVLTSYNCKTLLFYTIEGNGQEIWIPENLISCLRMCLKLLQEWISDRYIPNYFIPGQNMFEKMDAALKDKYGDFKLFVKELYCDWRFLFEIQFNGIGQLFLCKLNGFPIKSCGAEYTLNLPLSNDVAVNVELRKVCNSEVMKLVDLILCRMNFIDYVLDLLHSSQTCSERKTFEETIAELFLAWYAIPTTFDRFPQLLEPFQFSVEDNEKEPRAFAIKAVRSGLEINLASALAVLYFQNRDIRFLEESDTYLELSRSKSFDPITSRLVKATVMLKQIQYNDTNEELHAVETMCKERTMNCQCYEQHNIYQALPFLKQKHHTWLGCTFRNPDEVSGLVCPGCIFFKRCQLQLLPIALTFEAYRAFSSSTNSRSSFENKWVDSVAVDPVMYMYYLQFLNNEHNDPGRASVALQKMCSTLVERLGTWKMPGHFDTWLNVLGDIFAKKGWTRLALRCFKYSDKLRPRDNAVRWHVMFLLFPPPRNAL